MRLILLTLLVVCTSTLAQSAPVFVKFANQHKVYFDFDQSSLTSEARKELDELVDTRFKNVKEIRLTGFTDSRGSDEYNIRLSKRRVHAVKDYLVSKGIPSEKIKIDYKGEKNPAADNTSNEGRAKNRRVQIEWDPSVKSTVSEKTVVKSDIKDLYAQLEVERQEHTINNKRDTFVTLKQGTVVMIPANAFSANKVTLKIKEIYKTSDMLLENLTTTSGSQILETAGMFQFEAFDQFGNPLSLNNNKALTLFVKEKGNLRSDMQFFNGSRDPHGNMDWELSGDQPLRMSPRRFYWPLLIGCGNTCNFWCRMFEKKAFASRSRVKSASRRDIRAHNAEVLACKRGGGREFWNPINGAYESWEKMKSKYGVETYEQLRDSLESNYLRETENSFKKGKAKSSDIGFYVGNITQMGWINCDAFSNSDKPKITMISDEDSDEGSNAQLIFKEQRSIMAAGNDGTKFVFRNIIAGVAAWFVSIRFRDTKIFLGMKSLETGETVGRVEFREVTVDELKSELRKLD